LRANLTFKSQNLNNSHKSELNLLKNLRFWGLLKEETKDTDQI